MRFRERLEERAHKAWRLIKTEFLWGVALAGVFVLIYTVLEPGAGLGFVGIGIALISGGGVGVYMMLATKKISNRLYDSIETMSGRMDNMSGKIDTMSGKIDTMSDKIDNMSGKIDNMSGKIDTMSGKIDNMSGKIDNMSGKIDTMSGKIDNMSEQLSGKIDTQTDILKDIRNVLVDQFGPRKQPG